MAALIVVASLCRNGVNAVIRLEKVDYSPNPR